MTVDKLIKRKLSKKEIDELLLKVADRVIECGAEQEDVELSLAGTMCRLKSRSYLS